MKIIIKVIQILIVVMVLFSLISTYYEQDVSKRAYLFSKKSYESGEYKKEFKTIKDLNENRINSYRYDYITYKQKLYWDFSIVILVIILLFLKKHERKRL